MILLGKFSLHKKRKMKGKSRTMKDFPKLQDTIALKMLVCQ